MRRALVVLPLTLLLLAARIDPVFAQIPARVEPPYTLIDAESRVSLQVGAEFPLLLHGYNIEEISARRFLLVNLAYRFPIWPGQDRVHLQLLADYAWVDYIQGHRLPRSGLAGVGANPPGPGEDVA